MMRRLLLTAALILCAAGAQAAEIIHNYDTAIDVQADGTLHITETIDVTAEGAMIHRGIYRVLPQGRRMPLGGILPTDYDILSVTRDGADEPHFTERSGGALTLYIGDADTMLPHGRYIYEITYTVADQVTYFDAFDELNWNTIGTEWVFPIRNATATITLPDDAPVKSHAVYTGTVLSTDGDYESVVETGKLTVHTDDLEPGEGVTVALSWPKGYMTNTISGPAFFLRQHPGLLLMLAALAATIFYYLGAWQKHGRDPRQRRLAPFYTAPDGISPAMAAHIQKMGDANDDRALTAAVISLGAQGLIEIEETGKGSFTLHPTGKKGEKLSRDESVILACIGKSLSLTPSNPRWIAASEKHGEAVEESCGKTFFVDNLSFWFMGWLPLLACTGLLAFQGHISPFILFAMLIVIFIGDSVRALLVDNKRGLLRLRSAITVILTLPLTTIIFIIVGGLASGPVSWLTALVAALCALVIFMTRHALKRPTPRGLDIMEQIDGLQLYMEAVEEKVLKTFDPPQMSRQLYEEYLPYAVALNVESKWGKKFAASVAGAAAAAATAAAVTQPHWYKSTSGGGIGDFSVDRMVGSFSQALSAATTSPSSSGSSSSGGGSGGSVGSGGGGGGGGGW
jgi:uncharacterized membrane protein YgcG